MKRLLLLVLLMGIGMVPFSYAQVVADLGVRPMFLQNRLTLSQSGQPDLNLQDLGFPSQRTALQVYLALYTRDILFAYRITPKISLGTETLLPISVLMGTGKFGPSDTNTGGATTAKPVTLEGDVWSNQLELTWKKNFSFQPSFLAEVHSVNLSARQEDSEGKLKSAHAAKTFYDVGVGAVAVFPMERFVTIMKGYYLYGGDSNGVLLDAALTFRNIGMGYLYRSQTFKAGESSLRTQMWGPYLQLEVVF